MQDRLMAEIEEHARDTAEYQAAKEKSIQKSHEDFIKSQFADNREGRRAAQRALRKRNGYTR